MTPYIALILLPAFFSLINPRVVSKPAWIFVFCVYIVFVGLRYDVGPDWAQYIQLHYFTGLDNFFDVLASSEPLSYLLFWVSDNLGLDVYLTNIVAAIIMMTGVYAFAKSTQSPWLALLAASPYLIIVIGMSGIRQAMATGVILLLLAKWDNLKLISRAAIILIASMFHTSAIVAFIFLVTQLRAKPFIKITIGGALLLFAILLGGSVSTFSEGIAKYEARYIGGAGTISLGSLFHIAMIAIPAVIGFLFRRQIRPYVDKPQLLTFGLYASVVVLALNAVSTTAASRLTVYLYFIPMIVYSAFSMILGRNNTMVMAMAISMLHVLILVAWFAFANNSHSFLPYQNVLFH